MRGSFGSSRMLSLLLAEHDVCFVIIIFVLLLLTLYAFHKAIALSPPFELQQIDNENHQWVQTYGNGEAHLKSPYTDILAVNYLSNGKTLNATFWLASAFKDSSASIYNQPFRKIAYGMLIDANTNSKTGYNGADYDFYVESGSRENEYISLSAVITRCL